jgi:hypothetical protein
MLKRKSKKEKNFKFKSLKSYAWDRVIGNKFKFRTVFDKNEINYLSTEFTFYNKLFDEQDWEAKITIRGLAVDGNVNVKEICKKEEEICISKEENIVTYNYGWGEDKHGSYWKRGKYRWIASIDDEEVGYCDFYVEDYDRVTNSNNPYFEVLTLRTYEAPNGDIEESERKYLKSFDINQTRYIMGEICFSNKIETEWLCELFFNFFDDTGLLLGTSETMGLITPNRGTGEKFTISAGYGGEMPGSWIEDNYRLEVVFMDTTVAVIPFSVGDKNIERISDYEALLNEDVLGFFNATYVSKNVLNNDPVEINKNTSEEKNTNKEKAESEIEIGQKPLSEILAELDALIGLDSIKQKVREYVEFINFLQLRKEKGIVDDEEISLHSIFTGNPEQEKQPW